MSPTKKPSTNRCKKDKIFEGVKKCSSKGFCEKAYDFIFYIFTVKEIKKIILLLFFAGWVAKYQIK